MQLRDIERNSRVGLHLRADEWGEDVVSFTGEARLVTGVPPVHQFPEYVAKYTAGLAHIEVTPEQTSNEYSVVIRIVPVRVSGE